MHYTAEEKVTILRLHLLEEKTPISDLCDEVGLQPTVLYRWQKEFFENGAAAFQPKGRSNHPAEHERITYLERKIQTKHEVLAEHVALKKVLRNSDRSQGTARYAEQAAGDLVMLIEGDSASPETALQAQRNIERRRREPAEGFNSFLFRSFASE